LPRAPYKREAPFAVADFAVVGSGPKNRPLSTALRPPVCVIVILTWPLMFYTS
jgi:hypothetical protein